MMLASLDIDEDDTVECSVQLLGTFQVQHRGTAVTRFGGDKVRAMLAYLVVEADRPHAREAMAALFWPDLPTNGALRNLTQTLVRLREALGSCEPVVTTRRAVQWRPAAAEVDMATFIRLSASAEPDDLAHAAALYRGEFLAGFTLPDCETFEEWLLLTRERFQQQALGVLYTLAEHHLAAGHVVQAAEAARRQLELDPWREVAHRQLMRALAAAGDRGAAMAAYSRCCRVLRDDLDIEPDDETRILASRIEAGAARLVRWARGRACTHGGSSGRRRPASDRGGRRGRRQDPSGPGRCLGTVRTILGRRVVGAAGEH